MKKVILLFSMLLLAGFSRDGYAQFTESFESGIPGNWTVLNNGDPNAWEAGPPNGTAFAGTNVAYIIYDSSVAHDDYLISPQIAVVAGSTDQYSFYARNRSSSFQEQFNVLISTTGTAPGDFTLIDGPVSPPSGSWQEYVYNLTAYTGQNIYIAIQAISTNQWELYIDSVTSGASPSCPDPSALAAANITDTSADLSWTENGSATEWEIEYGPTGFTLGNGTIVNDADATASETISGLISNTDYDFYVTAICGPGDESNPVGPVAFTTPPGCGDMFYDSGGAANDYSSNENLSLTFYPDVPGNVVTLNFTAVDVEICCDDLAVYNGVGTGTALNSDLTAPESFTSTDPSGALTVTFSSDFSAVGAGWEAAVTCAPPPTCLPPTNLVVSNVMANSATLTWDAEPNASAGYYYWVYHAGDTPGVDPSETQGATVGTSGNLSFLSPLTDYEAYVLSDCGTADGQSVLAGPVAFTTTCPTFFTPDYTEDFSTFVPNCWNEANGGLPAAGPTTSGSSDWTSDDFANTGSDQSANINIYSSGDQSWLISPTIDLSGGGYELAYNVAVTDYANSDPSAMGSDDQVQVLISTDNGTTWANLLTYDTSNTPSNIGELEFIDLSAYTSATAKIAFWATNGATDDPEDYEFFFDNFEVRTPPACPDPSALAATNVMPTSVELSWTDNAGASEWEIEYGPTGFTPGTGTVVTDSDGTPDETLTSLTPETTYDFYITAICGPGDESNQEGPVSFTTLAVPPANDDLANAIALNVGAPCTGDAYNNNGATAQTGEPVGGCFTNNTTGVVDNSAWFSFVAPASGGVRISTDIMPGQIEDTEIAVYPAPTTPGDPSTLGAELGCDQDGGEVVGFGFMSVLELTGLTPGNTYYIQVDGYGGSQGAFCIVVSEIPDFIYEDGAWSPSDPSGTATATDNVLITGGTTSLTADTQLNNLRVNPGASLEIEQALMPSGDITNNGSILFVNDATMLGQLADMSGSTITGSGEVTVQRYIPARDDGKGAYRYITSAVNSTGSIHANWQEGAADINDDPNPGFGMFITGVGGSANGFDQTTANASSVFTFNEGTQAYVGIPNTNVDQLAAGTPYTAYVWGDRSVDIISSNDPVATTTTLRATGSLFTGAIGAGGNTTAGDFILFGNPYQAIVDMNDVLAGTDFNMSYYVWDPNLGTRGAYATVSLPSGAPTPGTSDANQFLQPGQAAFMAGNGGTSNILFEEADKDVTAAPTDVFRPENMAGIELQLFQTTRFANGQTLSDATRVNFTPGGNNAVQPNDAPKLSNRDENLALVNSNAHFAIENRAMPTDGETLQLYNDQYRVSDYTFKAIVDNLPDNTTAYLKDAYLDTQTQLNNNGPTLIAFSVDASMPASVAPDRFSIVFAVNGLSTADFASEGFVLYPNPVKEGGFFILTSGISGEKAQVTLYNLLGQQVYQAEREVGANNRIAVETHDLEAGVYLVEMAVSGKTFTEKLIIQ